MGGAMGELLARLDAARLGQLALDLLRVPSPTGDSRQVTLLYAQHLRELGLPVQLDETYPSSPAVYAYLEGNRPGPTLELAGHLDAIPVPHDSPEIREGVLYGRGAADMKGAMAAVLEAARLLTPLRAHFAGRLLICGYGMHEAPLGRGQVLARLIQRGIYGDAVINVEGPSDVVTVIGKGMSTFEITIRRTGEPVHEVAAPRDLPHPLLIGLEVANALRAWNEELSRETALPYVGPETVFIGQFESGDFYNRVPTACQIVGTRRYAPEKRFPQVEAEFQARLEPLRRRSVATIDLDLVKAKDGFRIGEDEPIVRLLQQAHREVTGQPLPPGGFTAVGDVSNFVNDAGVPAVYYGCGSQRAHATPEYVALAELERLAKVVLLASARYLGLRD